MDSSSSGDDEAVSQEPTVASILGIRGPLRFRNHGSTQKAHVVLRQIDLSEEPGDERGDSNMVYFSLFAQKRIEVKPGKEILLAVASPDGKFIDSPVIFAGSIVGGNLSDTSQAPLKPVVDVVSSKPTGYTMPPRMRKAWPSQGGVGLTGSGSPSHPPLKSTSYNSVGVQCQAPTVSLAVETDPNPVKTFTSFAVQAAEPPKVTKPQVIQTEVSVRSYQDGVAQTVSDALPPSPTPVATISQPLIDQPEETAAELEHERSLSPMELDSPPSSPTLTPVVEPSKPTTPSDLRAKSLSYSPRTFSPPRLSIVTSSTSQTLVAPEEARISPMHLSPDDGDAPGLAITPEAIEFHRAYTPPVDRSNLQLPPSKAPSPPQRPPLGSPIIPAADHPAPASVPSQPPAVLSTSPSAPSGNGTPEGSRSPAEPTRYVPKRKAVTNPFVSGGFLSDFVTTTTKTTTTPQPSSRPASPKQLEPQAQSSAQLPSTFAPPVSAPKASTPVEPTEKATPVSPTASSSGGSPLPPNLQAKAESPPPSLPASTSKVKMEDTSPSGISEKGEPLLSQAVITKEDEPSPAAPRARAAPPHANASMPDVPNHGYPVMPMMYPAYLPRGPPGTIPAVPARALHPSLTATYLHQWNPWQFNLLPDPNPPRTPPPEPKNIAHIPSGSYANPLNIKPARAPQPPMNSLQSPVAAASASAKKPVVVGSNWPYNTRSHSRAAAAGTNGAVKSQPAKAPSNDSDSPAAPSIPVTSETPTAGPSKQHSPAAHTQTGSSPEQIRTEPSPTEDKPTPIPADPPSSSTTDKVAAGKTIPPPLRVSLSGVTSYHPAVPSAPAGGSTSLPTPAAQPSVKSSTPVSVSPSTLTPLQTPTSATTSHPLPPKPPAFTGTAAGSYSPRRGVKRMVSPTAATSPEQKHKTGFVWATGDPIFGVKLKSDGDAGIRNITFNSDGTQFAVVCYDKSVRIWNRRTRQEIAKLGHTMQVIDVVWMEHDSGVITLGDNGLLSAWTRNAQNKWQWGKLVDLMANRTVRESPSCFALSRDRLAVAVPSEGVKVWIFMKGSWIPQRSIGRQKVTTIRFVDDGEALVGATEDGTLWHCEVPNGTLKAVKIYSKSLIASLDTDARGSLGLTALADGRCELVNIRLDANKGSVEQTFSVKDAVKDAELADSFAHDFGASFVSNGQNIIFGSVRGCVMVWDCGSGDVVYGLCHTEDEPIHTVSSFNGTPNLAGLILTGSRTGQLTWFTPPPTDAGPPSRKRSKT